MTKKKKKLIYAPPFARDLYDYGVSGQVSPQGFCSGGYAPSTSACATGTTPHDNPSTDCYPLGSLPTYGACYTGGSVAHGCESGSAPSI